MKTVELPASVLATVINALDCAIQETQERIIDAPGLPGGMDEEDLKFLESQEADLEMAIGVIESALDQTMKMNRKRDIEAITAALPDEARDVTIEHDRTITSGRVRRSSYEVRYWVPMNSGDMYLTISQRLEIVEDPESEWGPFRCYTIASDSIPHEGACPGGEA